MNKSPIKQLFDIHIRGIKHQFNKKCFFLSKVHFKLLEIVPNWKSFSNFCVMCVCVCVFPKLLPLIFLMFLWFFVIIFKCHYFPIVNSNFFSLFIIILQTKLFLIGEFFTKSENKILKLNIWNDFGDFQLINLKTFEKNHQNFKLASYKEPKVSKNVQFCFCSYFIYSQFWLNFLMVDCHFGYIISSNYLLH